MSRTYVSPADQIRARTAVPWVRWRAPEVEGDRIELGHRPAGGLHLENTPHPALRKCAIQRRRILDGVRL